MYAKMSRSLRLRRKEYTCSIWISWEYATQTRTHTNVSWRDSSMHMQNGETKKQQQQKIFHHHRDAGDTQLLRM